MENISFQTYEDLIGNDFVVFDLETTGLYFEYFDEPIEIGAVKIDKNLNIVDTYHVYILPKKKISPKITEITGLTEDLIKEYGHVDRKTAIKDLRIFIGDSIAVGHNARFDITFINYWLNYYKFNLLTKYICTEKTYRRIYKSKAAPKKGKFLTNLTAMCSYFSIENKQAHSAIEDTMATAKCFIKMLKSGDDVSLINLSLKEAYSEFKSRVFKSRIYSKILLEMTSVSPINLQRDIPEEQKNEIIAYLNKYEIPKKISEELDIPIGIVEGVLVDWISPVKLKKVSFYLWNDRRTPLTIKEILEKSNWDLNEAYDLMKYITPYPPDKVKFEIVKKLYGEGESFNYTVDDFEDYFINYQPIKSIQNGTNLDTANIIRFLGNWLIKHTDYIPLWIQALTPSYLLTEEEYRRMIKYREKSEEKYQKWYADLSEENLLRIENTQLFLNLNIIYYNKNTNP